jgi:hypothetical protein
VSDDELPDDMRLAYAFQALNAVSFQIALGSPLILFAREIGAPAAVIGIMSGFTPLLGTLQLLAVRYGERAGWRSLMVRGWSGRVAMLGFLLPIPLLVGRVPDWVPVALVVGVMFMFNFLRGFAAGAWTPMILTVVPRSMRGQYLSRDRLGQNLATVIALAVSGTILALGLGMAGYALIFLISFVCGVISLRLLMRVPYDHSKVTAHQDDVRIPYAHLLRDREFAKLVLFGVLVQIVFSSNATFALLFAREELHFNDGVLVYVAAAAALLAMGALSLLRLRIDAHGSTRYMWVSWGWWVVLFATWLLLSLTTPTFGWVIAILLLAGHGFFAAMFELANTRLLMLTAGDRVASARYLTFQGVVVSLASGIAPIVWGAVLDALRGAQISRFVVFFAFQLVMVGVIALLLRRMHEREA